jgi:hypothetical protein
MHHSLMLKISDAPIPSNMGNGNLLAAASDLGFKIAC